MARLASGGRYGFAQSVFQVGGQAGQALGPLLAAFIVVPRGQASISWFSLVALLAMVLLLQVGRWYKRQSPAPVKTRMAGAAASTQSPQTSVVLAVAILFLLMFSKSAYTASLSSYYTFYLIGTFSVSVQASQVLLFLFLVAQALGIADRRASGRPLRPPRDHLVLDPGGGAVHARSCRLPTCSGRPSSRSSSA